MTPQLSRQDPDVELQAAFRRHLPQRLRTLLRRARAQCRDGWDCNVLHALHDEIALLAGACGRYGMLETGERLLALEAALAVPVAAHGVPDAATSAEIDGLLDGLRPHLQQAAPGHATAAFAPGAAAFAAQEPFPRCEVPPPDYWLRLGISAVDAGDAAAAPATNAAIPAPESAPAAVADPASGPRVCIVNDDGPLVNELLLRFDQLHYDVVLVDRLADLVDLLGRTPPELAILVADARTPLEPLATAMQLVHHDHGRPVRLLMLLRGADAELQLRALRAGADRCIVLPAAASEVVPAALELAGADRDSAYRILIVDDDAPQALFAQAILRRSGMETKILSESLAVLDELDRFHPDLLLLDLNMPDCDGFELTALIREREGYVNTPIVFLSGDQDEERQFAALDAGGDDFLVKPIRPTHLVSAVTNRVRRARMAAARARSRQQRHVGDGLHERVQVLDAMAEHLAASGGSAQGGLLAVAVRDAAEWRQRFGVSALDAMLAQLGTFVASHARARCMVARHGEAGFLIFSRTDDELQLMALAGELMEAAQDTRFGAQAIAARLVCAVCAFDAATAEPALALAAVERTLAAARAQPDLLALYSHLGSASDGLDQQVSAALATHAFGLAFQPVIPLRGTAEPQYQALLRLRTGGREYVAAELVPIAARAGSIGAIDAWVVARCIGILAERMEEGDPVRLVASQALQGWRDLERPTALQGALAAAGVPEGSLVLEFRAEEVRHHMRALVELAPELRRAGVRLSLAGVDADGVAAGWIEHLPLDYIKLVPGLADAALAAAVRAAHARGVRVAAGCVETLAQVQRLREGGVDLLQGNYFRPPADKLGDAPAPAET
ncbi:MAG: EAL domain-containing protein [Rhodanobacteraceae bacterium]|nr:MAG: EAL domain-containing protein [Rhodanobacteraceae bacterium]